MLTGSSFGNWFAAFRFDGWFWRRFAYLGCVYGPEWWKRYSPAAIAAILFALIGRNRRGAAANQQVIRECGRWQANVAALRTFIEFAYCFSEALEHYGPRPKPLRLDVPGENSLTAALRRGRGAVIVTGHVGSWEIAAKGLRDYETRVNLVMARESNRSIQDHARRAREEAGLRVIYSDTSVFSSFNMIRALRRNEIVAMQLDRPLDAGGTRRVEMFGRPALFPSGPFVLARLAGSPVIPVFAARLGRRHYAVRIGRSYEVPRERDPAVLERVMTAVVAEFEDAVRAHPEQWFQFSPFWPGLRAARNGAHAPSEEGPAQEARAGRR